MINQTLRRPSAVPRLTALLTLPLWALACAEPVGPPDVTLFQTASCTDEGFLSLNGVRPLVPVNSMQLRQRTTGGTLRVVASVGEECATATDPDLCRSDLGEVPSAPGFHPCATSDCAVVLTTTTGNMVKSYPDTAALITFLGPIDTAADALLLVFAQGYNVSCTDTATGGVREALDHDGYEVLASLPTPGCNPQKITGYQFHVTRSGRLSYYSSWPITPVAGAFPCPP